MDYANYEPEALVNKILETADLCPCLLIGRYANAFKRVFRDTIERAYTLDEVKSMIDEYSGVSSVHSGVLAIDGVGYLSDTGQNALLKFIEESKVPIVLLSDSDRISPIIMSRMKMVFKLWYPVKSLNFSKVGDGQRGWTDKKKEIRKQRVATLDDEIQFYADNCPKLYLLKFSAGDPYDASNTKMIEALSRTGV